MLTIKEIESIISKNSVKDSSVYKKYHETNSINRGIRSDGRPRNTVYINYFKYIVDQLVGFIFNGDIEYTSEEDIRFILNQNIINNTPKLDTIHMKNCLLNGKSYEIILPDGRITSIKPYKNMAVIKDGDDNIFYAMMELELPAYSVFLGSLQRDSSKVIIYFDEDSIKWYQKIGRGEYFMVKEEVNPFDFVPVIEYNINDDMSPFFGKHTEALIDEYSNLMSLSLDDIDYNVDSFLKIVGFDPGSLLEKDENGKTLIQKIKEHRVLSIKGEGADAAFLQKSNEIVKFETMLERMKRDIMQVTGAVDYDNIINNQSTSGVALNIQFSQLLQNTESIKKRFTEGLYKRVSILSRQAEILNIPNPKPYDIKIKYQDEIPSNQIELIKVIDKLLAVMNTKQVLEFIPGIENVEEMIKEQQDGENNVEEIIEEDQTVD